MPRLIRMVRERLTRAKKSIRTVRGDLRRAQLDKSAYRGASSYLPPFPKRTEEVFVSYLKNNDAEVAGEVSFIGGDTFTSLIGEPLFSRVRPEQILGGGCKGYFVVLMRGSDTELDEYLRVVPSEHLQAVRSGRAGLILDHSREGTAYRADRAAAWHAALSELAIDPSRVIYVTQNMHCRAEYLAWATTHSLPQKLHVLTYDYYIKRFFSRSWRKPSDVYVRRKANFLRKRIIERNYISLNYKPRAWRIALLTHLIRDGLWDDGFISFGGLVESDLKIVKREGIPPSLDPVSQFLKLKISPESEKFLGALENKEKVYFGSKVHGKDDDTKVRTLDLESDLFQRSAFSLITETEMQRFARRLTEKPFKALANCHPLIVFGNYNALELIRRLGFLTFGDWIDESYDTIRSPDKRFRSAYDAFRDFNQRCEKPVLQDPALREVLLFNLEHSMFGVQRLFSDVFDRQIQRQVREAVPFQ